MSQYKQKTTSIKNTGTKQSSVSGRSGYSQSTTSLPTGTKEAPCGAGRDYSGTGHASTLKTGTKS